MSAFVARPPAAEALEDPQDAAPIENDGFFPDIDPAQIRKAGRISTSVTNARLRAALIAAIITVGNDLTSWAEEQQAAGHAKLEDVPARLIDGQSHRVHAYNRAVTCFARAEVIERYRDFDTTGAGGKALDPLDATVEDLRRDGQHAIRDILSRSRTTVDLI